MCPQTLTRSLLLLSFAVLTSQMTTEQTHVVTAVLSFLHPLLWTVSPLKYVWVLPLFHLSCALPQSLEMNKSCLPQSVVIL